MPTAVTSTALLTCSFGVTPTMLNVISTNSASSLPLGNTISNKPLVNVPTFGMCQCPANPVVAAATAAAFGVLTPMPCLPSLAAPWISGVPKVTNGSMPILDSTSKLMCVYGGSISISSAGQFVVSV